MQYIRVAKDKPEDPREQGIELAGINTPVPASPDFRVKQERDRSFANDNDAPSPRPKRERIIDLREDDAAADPRKRSKQ